MFVSFLAFLLDTGSFVGETRPIHLTVVDVAGDPVVGAEVLVVDDDDVDTPDHWTDVHIVEWLVSHGSLAGQTDAEGVAWIAEAPIEVWALIQSGDRSAIVHLERRDNRNRRVTIEVDRPLRIRTVDGDGLPVSGVRVGLQASGGGGYCGWSIGQWSGRSNELGELDLTHPRHYVREHVFWEPDQFCGLRLNAETPDGECFGRALGPEECMPGGLVEFVLVKPAERDRGSFRDVRIRVRDDTGTVLTGGFEWFGAAGDLSMPLMLTPSLIARSAREPGIVPMSVSEGLDEGARWLLIATTSEGKEGRAVLNPAHLASDELVDVTLEVVKPTIRGAVIVTGQSRFGAHSTVTLYTSLPLRDHPRDRAAAVRAMRDPDDRGRILWPFQTCDRKHTDRFEFAEPWPLFGGSDPRWFVAAEVEGWWRSDPVLVPEDRSPIEIPLAPWDQ